MSGNKNKTIFASQRVTPLGCIGPGKTDSQERAGVSTTRKCSSRNLATHCHIFVTKKLDATGHCAAAADHADSLGKTGMNGTFKDFRGMVPNDILKSFTRGTAWGCSVLSRNGWLSYASHPVPMIEG